MKVYACGCLFDYYKYLMHRQRAFFVKADKYQKDNVGQTVNFSKQQFYVQVCYTCFFQYSNLKSLM